MNIPCICARGFAGMPSALGVYIFHGAEGDLPLYVGKSVNLRSRLLVLLRTADEARLLRQALRISHVRAAGEIGALLLEARLVKEMYPLFNQRLRRSRLLCARRMNGDQPDDFQVHVVRRWCYLGSVTDRKQAAELDSVSAGFDADGYKILCKPVLSGRSEIILL